MGNQLIKNYDVDKDPVSVGGLNGHWKIYNGYKQDKQRTPVSVFMFDKKSLDKGAKSVREEVYALLQREAQTLAKFKHPNIVGLVEPLVQDQKYMGFVTERVDNTIYNLLAQNDIKTLCPSQLEIKLHLQQITDTLAFLHNNLRLTHLNLCPENIYITPDNRWKIGGFIFSTQIPSTNTITEVSSIDYTVKASYSFIQPHPNLNFTAPQIAEIPPKCIFSSDIFSLGMLIVAIFKCQFNDSCADYLLVPNIQNRSSYASRMKDIQHAIQTCKPIQLMSNSFESLVVWMTKYQFNDRASLQDILNSEYLKDPFVKTIKHLEKITEMEQAAQINFIKGLANIITKYEDNVVRKRIFPKLNDLMQFPYLIPPILMTYLDLLQLESQYIKKGQFNEIIWPHIKALTSGQEMPAQGLFILVSSVETFNRYLEKDQLQKVLIPLIIQCFQCQVPKLQELALRQTDFLAQNMDYTFIKNQLLPRVLALCINPAANLKRNAVICLNQLCPILDQTIIGEQVLPTLEQIRKSGTDIRLNMIILNIYEGISQNIDLQTIANQMMPSMIPFLIDPNLNKKEFLAYMKTTQSLLQRIQQERLQAMPQTDDTSPNDLMSMDFQKEEEGIGVANSGQKPKSTGFSDFDFLSEFQNSNAIQKPKQNVVQTPISVPPNSGMQAKIEETKTNQNQNNLGNFNNNNQTPPFSTNPKQSNVDVFRSPPQPINQIQSNTDDFFKDVNFIAPQKPSANNSGGSILTGMNQKKIENPPTQPKMVNNTFGTNVDPFNPNSKPINTSNINLRMNTFQAPVNNKVNNFNYNFQETAQDPFDINIPPSIPFNSNPAPLPNTNLNLNNYKAPTTATNTSNSNPIQKEPQFNAFDFSNSNNDPFAELTNSSNGGTSDWSWGGISPPQVDFNPTIATSKPNTNNNNNNNNNNLFSNMNVKQTNNFGGQGDLI